MRKDVIYIVVPIIMVGIMAAILVLVTAPKKITPQEDYTRLEAEYIAASCLSESELFPLTDTVDEVELILRKIREEYPQVRHIVYPKHWIDNYSIWFRFLSPPNEDMKNEFRWTIWNLDGNFKIEYGMRLDDLPFDVDALVTFKNPINRYAINNLLKDEFYESANDDERLIESMGEYYSPEYYNEIAAKLVIINFYPVPDNDQVLYEVEMAYCVGLDTEKQKSGDSFKFKVMKDCEKKLISEFHISQTINKN